MSDPFLSWGSELSRPQTALDPFWDMGCLPLLGYQRILRRNTFSEVEGGRAETPAVQQLTVNS